MRATLNWVSLAMSLMVIPYGFTQSVIPKVPYATGTLVWTWMQGDHPLENEAVQLNVKCGAQSGHYTVLSPPLMLQAPPANPPEYVSTIAGNVPDVGVWYCAASASAGNAESTMSPEIVFEASAEPTFDVTPPVLAITSPHAGDVLTAPVTIEVSARDDSGLVTSVAVFVGQESICLLTGAPPYVCVWHTLLQGAFSLQAGARDATGNVSLSDIVRIRVRK